MGRPKGSKNKRGYPAPVLDPESGCLRWQGPHNKHGYGVISFGTGRAYVHRYVWEQVNGPIPEGMTIDHVLARGCVWRDCVNQDHLELVTLAENARRTSKMIDQRARTHCPQGHEYTEENTIIKITPNGSKKRECRACAYIRNAKNRAIRRAKNKGV